MDTAALPTQCTWRRYIPGGPRRICVGRPGSAGQFRPGRLAVADDTGARLRKPFDQGTWEVLAMVTAADCLTFSEMGFERTACAQ